MAFRLGSIQKPVEITLDDEKIVAEDGEPLVHALLASGAVALARSPKFHRPRGPACLRAACDGCLMRVDGVPNIMTCLAPAREGTAVVSQNTLGSRKVDFLRVTDWFFPEGMNHHELFAGVPGVQNVMQAFARRVAGLGRIPERDESGLGAVRAPRPAVRRTADVLVVGAGPAGLAAAALLAKAGRAVEIIDDALTPGRSLQALGSSFAEVAEVAGPLLDPKTGAARISATTVAGAVFPDGVLVVGPDTTEVIESKVLLLAPGAHDGVLAFEGNDLPGIMSARAGLWLLAAGIGVGKHVVVAVPPGGGPYGALFEAEVKRLGAPIAVTVIPDAPTAAGGSGRVKDVTFGEGKNRKTSKVDALLVDAPRAPSYELCAQAGAKLEHVPAGFVTRTERGRIRRGVYACGEVTGAPLDAARFLADAYEIVRTIASDGV